MKRIVQRLLKWPALSCAVDLEGELGCPRSRVDLLQISVLAIPRSTDPDDNSLLCYVLDTHRCKAILRERGEHTFRWILQSETIAKSFHCCRGDTSALYYEFGIQCRDVFDTGVADCLVCFRKLNKPMVRLSATDGPTMIK